VWPSPATRIEFNWHPFYRLDCCAGYGVRLDDLDESGGFPAKPSHRRSGCAAAQIARTTTSRAGRPFAWAGPAGDALRELLDSCRDDGVRAALVVMPEGRRSVAGIRRKPGRNFRNGWTGSAGNAAPR